MWDADRLWFWHARWDAEAQADFWARMKAGGEDAPYEKSGFL